MQTKPQGVLLCLHSLDGGFRANGVASFAPSLSAHMRIPALTFQVGSSDQCRKQHRQTKKPTCPGARARGPLAGLPDVELLRLGQENQLLACLTFTLHGAGATGTERARERWLPCSPSQRNWKEEDPRNSALCKL